MCLIFALISQQYLHHNNMHEVLSSLFYVMNEINEEINILQAFASTITGTLTTHSIMKGIGVGESNATPLAAAITWILKSGTGMIGSIMFAWWNG